MLSDLLGSDGISMIMIVINSSSSSSNNSSSRSNSHSNSKSGSKSDSNSHRLAQEAPASERQQLTGRERSVDDEDPPMEQILRIDRFVDGIILISH